MAGREKGKAAGKMCEEWPEGIEAIRFVKEKAFGQPLSPMILFRNPRSWEFGGIRA
jgi:hypothetical protein